MWRSQDVGVVSSCQRTVNRLCQRSGSPLLCGRRVLRRKNRFPLMSSSISFAVSCSFGLRISKRGTHPSGEARRLKLRSSTSIGDLLSSSVFVYAAEVEPGRDLPRQSPRLHHYVESVESLLRFVNFPHLLSSLAQ